MIQRIQSIWLLLATVFAALTFVLPFAIGTAVPVTDGTPVTLPGVTAEVNAQSSTWLTIVTAFAGALAFIDIFLFNNRKLQFRLCLAGIFLSLIMLALDFVEMSNVAGTLALSCLIYFAVPGFYIMAAVGIRKDEKLIKSMDRLR
jgi:ABC-type cobalamin transport system permease subunit